MLLSLILFSIVRAAVFVFSVLFIDANCSFSMAARIYIGRLSERASERDVEHFFRGYGRIREIILKNGFGFVVSLSSFISKIARHFASLNIKKNMLK